MKLAIKCFVLALACLCLAAVLQHGSPLDVLLANLRAQAEFTKRMTK